jgi:lipid-A-disaccharide synthase-like uncharacterized protein
MYDVARELRRNRGLIAVNSCLLVGALGLLVFGRRSLVAWVVLASCITNLMSSLVSRRALFRLSSALSQRDRAG